MDEFITVNRKERDILQSLAKIFVSVHMIDIRRQTFYRVDCEEYIQDVLKLFPVAQEAFDKVIEYLVQPVSVEKMTDFLNISTLQERLADQDLISCDFVGTIERWSRGYFIALTRDADGQVEQVVFAVQNIDKEKSREESLKKLSETDGLTGLLNRHALKDCFASIEDADVTMIMLDIDHFKYFNDTFGHDVGDKIIQTCAAIIMDEFSMCNCYRYGGDEYLILAVGQDEKVLREHLERAAKKIGEKRIKKDVPTIEISHGMVSGHPKSQEEIDKLFRRVDRLLYKEKRSKFNELDVM